MRKACIASILLSIQMRFDSVGVAFLTQYHFLAKELDKSYSDYFDQNPNTPIATRRIDQHRYS
jgi:hypothetical protein